MKVQMIPCDSHNLALPTKLTLSTIQALKRCTALLRIQCNLIQYLRDLSEYMAEDAVGVALEADGETVIITNIEELVESDVEKYFVSKIVNRGKVYFKLAENC